MGGDARGDSGDDEISQHRAVFRGVLRPWLPSVETRCPGTRSSPDIAVRQYTGRLIMNVDTLRGQEAVC
jgi:hypothetical protein